MPKKLVLVALLLLIALTTLFWATRGASSTRPNFLHSRFDITNENGKIFSFAAEIARTPEEQAYGLMFIQSMPDDSGMIFPYSPPREISFWMKNTLIPLDMLFIRPDHTIGRIVAYAKPQDLTPIASQQSVIAVIEIKGGIAEKNGFAVGDKVSSPDIP